NDAPPNPEGGKPVPTGAVRRMRNPGTVALVVIAVLLTAGVFTYLGPILKPLLVAVFLYFATEAAAACLIRFGFPKLLAYCILFAVAVGLMTTLSLFVVNEARGFRDDWPKYQERVVKLIDEYSGSARQPLEEAFKNSSREILNFAFEAGVG